MVLAGPPPYDPGPREPAPWSHATVMAWAVAAVCWVGECTPYSVFTHVYLPQEERVPHVQMLFVARVPDGTPGWSHVQHSFSGLPADLPRKRYYLHMREMQSRYHEQVSFPFDFERDRGLDAPAAHEPIDRHKGEVERAAELGYSPAYLLNADPAVQRAAFEGGVALRTELNALRGEVDAGKHENTTLQQQLIHANSHYWCVAAALVWFVEGLHIYRAQDVPRLYLDDLLRQMPRRNYLPLQVRAYLPPLSTPEERHAFEQEAPEAAAAAQARLNALA